MGEIAARKIPGMPVYSINEGESIGVVRNVIVDPVGKKLMALAVDKRGWYRDTRIIPFSRVRHIGTDAVTIEERSNAERVNNLPQLVKYLRQPIQLLGSRVITDTGHTLGRLEEYYVDRQTGVISRLDIAGGVKGNILAGRASVDGCHLLTVGGAAIVVSSEAVSELVNVESQIKQSFLEAKDKAAQVWQNTLRSPRKWSKGFTETVNRLTEEADKEAAARDAAAKKEAEREIAKEAAAKEAAAKDAAAKEAAAKEAAAKEAAAKEAVAKEAAAKEAAAKEAAAKEAAAKETAAKEAAAKEAAAKEAAAKEAAAKEAAAKEAAAKEAAAKEAAAKEAAAKEAAAKEAAAKEAAAKEAAAKEAAAKEAAAKVAAAKEAAAKKAAIKTPPKK